jgi:predicted nucleic acid-binding protein
MGQYLIDNNVISNYFSGLFAPHAMGLIAGIIDDIPNISVITEIEALSWINPNKKKEEIVAAFISETNVLTITPEIVKQCVAIRRKRRINTPDAIIAATAMVHGLILITSDKDFDHIKKLQVIDPFKL